VTQLFNGAFSILSEVKYLLVKNRVDLLPGKMPKNKIIWARKDTDVTTNLRIKK